MGLDPVLCPGAYLSEAGGNGLESKSNEFIFSLVHFDHLSPAQCDFSAVIYEGEF